jgi:hypothetical protein
MICADLDSVLDNRFQSPCSSGFVPVRFPSNLIPFPSNFTSCGCRKLTRSNKISEISVIWSAVLVSAHCRPGGGSGWQSNSETRSAGWTLVQLQLSRRFPLASHSFPISTSHSALYSVLHSVPSFPVGFPSDLIPFPLQLRILFYFGLIHVT